MIHLFHPMILVRPFLILSIHFQAILFVLIPLLNQCNLVTVVMLTHLYNLFDNSAKVNKNSKKIPLYERLTWDFKNANYRLINREMRSFVRAKHLNVKIFAIWTRYTFKETITNIFRNFFPNKVPFCLMTELKKYQTRKISCNI